VEPSNYLLNDTEAMDAIHQLLSGTKWSADTLAEVVSVVEDTGRPVEPPEEIFDGDQG
jgi:hypothetical protein